MNSLVRTMLCLAAGFMLVMCGRAWSVVTASVDPATVDEMETVMFTLRVSGSNQAEEIDLSPLDADFEVLGTNTSSQFRSINGRVQSWVEYQISLRPKSTGVLQIPPLSAAGEQSQAVEVRVNALDPDVRASINRMIFFETEVSDDPVYVQAQTILTRRLYYSGGVQIYSDLPDMPDLANAVVISMGDMRSSTEFRDGERYGVLEQRFAIFPERSGDLTIPRISVTSSIRLQSRGRLRRSGVRVSTEELVLNVLPIPAEYPVDQPWLPATDVQISETWDPDKTSFEVGEPVARTVTVRVQANSASSISPLPVPLDDSYFKQYPEPETLSDDVSDASVRGERTQTYSIIPVQPGTISTGDVAVVWWDTSQKVVKRALLPQRTVRITGSLPAVPTSAPQTQQIPAEQPATPASAGRLDPPEQVSSPLLYGLAAAALVGWCLAGWLYVRRRPSRNEPAVDPSTPARQIRARNLKLLKQACDTPDLALVRSRLVDYLQAYYQTSSTEALRKFQILDAGSTAMRDLNAALYADAVSAQNQKAIAGAVLQAAKALQTVADEPSHQRGLPPLYPHNT